MHQASYSVYRNLQALQTTIGKMLGTDFGEAKESYRIKRLGDEINQHYNQFREKYAILYGEAEWEAVKDEKGEIIPVTERVAKNQDYLNERTAELFSEKIEFKWAPIPEETLDKMNLAPADYEVLQFFIDEKKLAHSAANGIMAENLEEWNNVEAGKQVAN